MPVQSPRRGSARVGDLKVEISMNPQSRTAPSPKELSVASTSDGRASGGEPENPGCGEIGRSRSAHGGMTWCRDSDRTADRHGRDHRQ